MNNIEKMKKQLDKWRDIYYNVGEGAVPDEVYDAYLKEYELLVQEETGEAPHRAVGSYVRDIYNRVKHKKPMLSLKDVFSKEELYTWLTTCLKGLGDRVVYMVEWKNDGLATSLHYVDDKLDMVLLRGDGQYGEDVTESFKRTTNGQWDEVQGIGTVEVRGEAVVLTETFDNYHAERSDNDPKYSTERHMAAGVIRNRNSKPGLITFLPYDIDTSANQNDKALYLEERFKHPVLQGQFQFNGEESLDEWMNNSTVSKYIDRCQQDRVKLGRLVDGLVFKVVKLADQSELGMAASWPQWAVAYKFPPEGKWSVLRGVYWQVGRTGRLTPVAEIDTVNVSGVDITNPTLHNWAEIERLNLKIGSKVYVERRGDVIPKITYVEGGDQEVVCPTHCPECDHVVTKMVTKDDVKEPICTNNDCVGMLTQKFLYIAGTDGLNVKGLGWSYIDTLVRNGVLKEPIDIFKLTDQDLHIAGIVEKNVKKIRKGIERYRQIPLDKWIFIQCLPGIGKVTSKKYTSLTEFTNSTNWKTALTRSLVSDVDAWREYVHIVLPEAVDGLIPVYITGSLDVSKSEAASMLRECGYDLQSSFNSQVKILFIGNNPSQSKVNKAKKTGMLKVYGSPPALDNILASLSTTLRSIVLV